MQVDGQMETDTETEKQLWRVQHGHGQMPEGGRAGEALGQETGVGRWGWRDVRMEGWMQMCRGVMDRCIDLWTAGGFRP